MLSSGHLARSHPSIASPISRSPYPAAPATVTGCQQSVTRNRALRSSPDRRCSDYLPFCRPSDRQNLPCKNGNLITDRRAHHAVILTVGDGGDNGVRSACNRISIENRPPRTCRIRARASVPRSGLPPPWYRRGLAVKGRASRSCCTASVAIPRGRSRSNTSDRAHVDVIIGSSSISNRAFITNARTSSPGVLGGDLQRHVRAERRRC